MKLHIIPKDQILKSGTCRIMMIEWPKAEIAGFDNPAFVANGKALDAMSGQGKANAFQRTIRPGGEFCLRNIRSFTK